jgi:hypothetical protein
VAEVWSLRKFIRSNVGHKGVCLQDFMETCIHEGVKSSVEGRPIPSTEKKRRWMTHSVVLTTGCLRNMFTYLLTYLLHGAGHYLKC